MKMLLLLLVLIGAACAFVPGVLPALEEIMGLAPVPTMQLNTPNPAAERELAWGEPESSLTLMPAEDAATGPDGEAIQPEALPLVIDSGSTLGLLTAIQSHAERAGITCSTIESSSDHQGGGAGDGQGAAPHWHLAGHGDPTGIVAFVAQLEGDGPLSTLDRVELTPHDGQQLGFAIDLRIATDGEAR